MHTYLRQTIADILYFHFGDHVVVTTFWANRN